MPMRRAIRALALLLVLVLAAVLCRLVMTNPVPDASADRAAPAAAPAMNRMLSEAEDAEPPPGDPAVDAADAAVADEAEDLSEEERRVRAEDALVEAFDAETDRWMDFEKTRPPTMTEVESFRRRFQGLPADRKEECLQRALNLIPDENVMLLVGILMDKSEDKDLVTLVYHDILNRDESVKTPILNTIYADRKHPCWEDTAWILDATGVRPRGGGESAR